MSNKRTEKEFAETVIKHINNTLLIGRFRIDFNHNKIKLEDKTCKLKVQMLQVTDLEIKEKNYSIRSYSMNRMETNDLENCEQELELESSPYRVFGLSVEIKKVYKWK